MNESPLLVFPTTEANWLNENVRTEGMTLRDYFAAKAMLAIGVTYHDDQHDEIATVSYKMADAMLKARDE